MEVRILQFNNPLAEDIMFLVYDITNVSEKDLPVNYFGMHGDPHVGGWTDYSDDRAGFVDNTGFSLQTAFEFPQRSWNMVFAWDPDGKGISSLPSGYFGWKFLESPSDASNGMDDDGDGINDESSENAAGVFIDGTNFPLEYGIEDVVRYTEVYGAPKARWEGDEDGDWNAERDDVGIDGIGPASPNYDAGKPDIGEGDGKPTQIFYLDNNNDDIFDIAFEPFSEERLPGYEWAGSEPSFGRRDVSESDQIGLKSFVAADFNDPLNVPKEDERVWGWMSAGKVDTAGQTLLLEPGDNIFSFGTGPLKLDVGESQRFSMCILFGSDINDLVLNAVISEQILDIDYRFAQPPSKPVVTAVPGDGRVTLYWDSKSEGSIDPLTGEMDFLGYKIYRSRDYTFSDLTTITDGNGNPFLREAFINPETGQRAQWHYKLDPAVYINGFHPVEYQGRGIRYWAGDPRYEDGLVHEFVDSSVTNGIKYYYAVIAYDRGSLTPGSELPPTETQSVIRRDPITQIFSYDVNTIGVVPGPKGAGMVDAEAGTFGIPQHVRGNATGDVKIAILNELKVQDDKVYSLEFSGDTTYSLLDSTGVTDRIIAKDTLFVSLTNGNIKEGSVVVKDLNGNEIPSSNYIVKASDGKIKGANVGALPNFQEFNVSYSYYPISKSSKVKFEDSNPVFDGMKVFLQNVKLGLDSANIKFNNPDINVTNSTRLATFPPGARDDRIDFEIRFLDLDTLAGGTWVNIGDTSFNTTLDDVLCPFNAFNVLGQEVKANFLVNEGVTTNNGQWDWGEAIVFQPQENPGFQTTYEVTFRIDTSVSNPVLPGQGDIFHIKTKKPFQKGELYTFTTKGVEFRPSAAKDELNKIKVVPNPYVAFSAFEEPGQTSDKRGERVIQFRNLPPKCTIRIYTLTGELIKTIDKDDLSSIASWSLLSFEGQRIAYGVYIYHVDVPEVGETIGRIAVIK